MPQTFLEQTPASRTESSYISPPQEQTEAPSASVATTTPSLPAVVQAVPFKRPKTAARKLPRRRGKRLVRRLVPLVVFYAPALFLYAWISRHGFIHIPFLNDKSFWLALPWQAIITFIGGLVALFEYNRNFRLKKDQFAQDKVQAEKAHTQKEEQFKNDQLQKQMQFEEKAQEDLFKDTKDRFANPTDPKTRALAAQSLAEMAQLPRPNAKGKPICDANNPFFLRAAAFLTTALHMEENDSVRAANKKALANMVDFVKGKEENDLLLRALIKDLYEANQTAKRAFIKSLAEFCPSKESGTEPDFELLTAAAPFTDRKDATEITLRSLMATDEFTTDRAIYSELMKEGRAVSDSLLKVYQTDAARLIDTRDALAVALCTLSRSNNLPKADAAHGEWYLYSEEFGLGLNGVFLAGAHMEEAELSGAKLNGAQLYGAQFTRANLSGANFTGAHFSGARLTGAQLTGASIQNAQLSGAILEFPDGSSPHSAFYSNWRQANFTNDNGIKDERVWELLVDHYGTDEEKAELAAQQAAKDAENTHATP